MSQSPEPSATVPTAGHTSITARSQVVRPDVHVAVLGPLEVTVAGRQVALGRGQPRGLLLALTAHRHRVVSDDHLLDALWSDRALSLGGLRNAAMRLRQALAEGAWAIERVGAGYRLARGVVVDADVIANQTDPDVVLAMVRGAPFEEAAGAGWALRAIDAANEAVALAEDRIAARIVAAADPGGVALLQRFAAERPNAEQRWVNLMALLRTLGRRAEALRAARAARAALAAVGLSPGPELRRLEQAVLMDDEAMAS